MAGTWIFHGKEGLDTDFLRKKKKFSIVNIVSIVNSEFWDLARNAVLIIKAHSKSSQTGLHVLPKRSKRKKPQP